MTALLMPLLSVVCAVVLFCTPLIVVDRMSDESFERWRSRIFRNGHVHES